MASTDAPTPVEIVSPTPLPVAIAQPKHPPPAVQDQAIDPSVAAKTTYQEDLTTAGQRAVNLIWETTQGNVANRVIIGALAIDGITIALSLITGREITAAIMAALGFVNGLATGVTSFYFSRTNHTQIGGTGAKPEGPYIGR
jgi:hypothetical protein